MLARHRRSAAAGLLFLGLVAAPAGAASDVDCPLDAPLALDGHRLLASFQCPEVGLGAGGERGEIVLELESSTNLGGGLEDFEVTVTRLADPANPVPALPAGVFLSSSFPIVVDVTLSNDAFFSFGPRWSLELTTEDLRYTSDTPLRLFRSTAEQEFRDVTTGIGSGSYRVKTFGGSFSRFAVAADLRPPRVVVRDKLAELESYLGNDFGEGENFVDSGVLEQLETRRQAAKAEHDAEELELARNAMVGFLADLRTALASEKIDGMYHSGDSVPKSVYGELWVRGASLLFALQQRLERATEPPGAGFRERRVTAEGREVDLELVFQGGTDLTAQDFEIEVLDLSEASSPSLADVASRLPEGVSIPPELPVLIVIEPPAGAPHWFSDAFELEVTTPHLALAARRRFGLFKAADGSSPFREISSSVGVGSYRVKGFGGSFSQFVVGEDERDREGVAAAKLEALQILVDGGGDSGQVVEPALSELKAALETLGNALQGTVDWPAVRDACDVTLGVVEEHGGDSVAGVWSGEGVLLGSAHTPAEKGVQQGSGNYAGEIRALLESLRFDAVSQASPLAPEPGDVDGDGDVDVADVLLLIGMVYGTAE